MSAFIVDLNKLQAAERMVAKAATSSDCYQSDAFPWPFRSLSWEGKTKQIRSLFRQLWVVNHKAVRGRYQGRKSGFSPYGTAHPRAEFRSPIALLKFLECLSYQCEEFTDETRPKILDTLDAMVNGLGLYIAKQTDEYRDAAWG